ncbi:hypothetical protein QTP88_023858 [Uroleucon formosanum]
MRLFSSYLILALMSSSDANMRSARNTTLDFVVDSISHGQSALVAYAAILSYFFSWQGEQLPVRPSSVLSRSSSTAFSITRFLCPMMAPYDQDGLYVRVPRVRPSAGAHPPTNFYFDDLTAT